MSFSTFRALRENLLATFPYIGSYLETFISQGRKIVAISRLDNHPILFLNEKHPFSMSGVHLVNTNHLIFIHVFSMFLFD